MPFKKTIIALILIAALAAWGWLSLLPGIARGKIETYLTQAGHKPYAMGKITLRPPYILAQNIQMDADGFNTIGLIGMQTSGIGLTVAQTRIDDIHTSTTVESIGAILRLITGMQTNLPDGALTIDRMVSDFATPYGDLRLETSLSLDAPNTEGARVITATVKARQYQLSFDTKWEGVINADGGVRLDAEIMDGRLNIGPARLARLTGWLSWQSQGQGLPQISGQIDAGSGTLLNLPLSAINLTISSSDNLIDLMFRTGLSGIENVHASIDGRITPDDNTFQSALEIPNGAAFLDYVHTLHPKDNIPSALRINGPVRIGMNYREERRFEGGPLPFTLSATRGDEKLLTGNILLYPDTYELRGAAQTTEDIAAALQEYFGMANDKRTGGALRLDGSAKNLLTNEEDGQTVTP